MARMVGLVLAVVVALGLAPAARAAGLSATQRALSREMAHAGRSSGAYVMDLTTGERLFSRRAGTRRIPASVEKLYTSATALLRYGPEGVLQTSLLTSSPPDAAGVIQGDLVLRGGGDPTFGEPQVEAIAESLANMGVTQVSGRIVGDESGFDGFRGPPSSGLRTSIYVGPLSALAFNHGVTGKRRPFFQPQPAKFAAQAFKRALKRVHIRVLGSARAGVAVSSAQPLLSWNSPSMAEIVRRMNQPSDNYMAETLIKSLGATFGGRGSTAAGAAVVRSTIAGQGVRPRLVDGSGLSRSDRTSPRQVVKLLAAMSATAAALPFAASLPVAGRSGTLAKRMRHTAAAGRCSAKTGTLSNVSTLAGYCTTVSGERLAFAFLMNRVFPLGAHRLQDRMTAALARYHPLAR